MADLKQIILVEDETYMREELTQLLEKEKYSVEAYESFDKITEKILKSAPDLVLLDINLPGISGFQICKELKSKSGIPVLVLTSRDQMKDELHALELGADEYLTKPCRKERLLARISNVLKRYEGRANLLEGNGFLLDRFTYTLYMNNESKIMPKNQGKMLEYFLLHIDEIITKDELNLALWETTEFVDENSLQVNLTRLRKTMQTLNMKQKIVTISGKGYKIVCEEKYEG